MEYVKERIVMCVNNAIYEFAGTATTLPTAVYSHGDTDHVFTSITASGPAIYVAGYGGIQSNIYKFTLNTSGAMPTISQAITAAEMPTGEIIHKIYYYLGYMLIGTSKGIRVALVNDQDGSIQYGPLVVETSQPCYDFAARDHFVWCATSVDGEPGIIRIDL
jgi:carbon starvation protein CstA